MEHQSLYKELSSCCLAWRIDAQANGRLQASADFVFPAGYIGFQGHFPDKPILPAIVQLAAVRYLAECAVGHKLLPRKVNKTKFKGMIGPDERVAVAVALSAGSGGWQGKFSLTKSDGETAAGGSVEFISEGI
ncbi:MAG: hypothetical protein ACD_75C01220G0003 [uncultured bacterium]|nr:MAG: hypothetical protein ACD_75C01220G0003 [uncultured bacterium]HBG18589.1 beta-hydroxyacyl-ACP dehydratase [Desulfobulbaceae bacterium]